MMMRHIKNFFVEHWQLKITSLAIAVVLSAYARLSQSNQQQISLPIQFVNIPKSMMITDASVTHVRLLVRGARSVLSDLPDPLPTYNIDLAQNEAGKHRISVDLNSLPLPRGVDVLQIAPQEIRFQLDQTQSYARPVRAKTRGTPAQGFQVVAVEAEPKSIELVGVRGSLDDRDSFYTDAVDVEGKAESVTVQVPIQLGDTPIREVSSRTATVTVRIVAATRTRKFVDVPVSVAGLQSPQWRPSPSSVDVEVMGTDAALKSLESAGLHAEVLLDAPPKRRQKYQVTVRLPADVTLISVTPTTVTVRNEQ